MFLVCGEALFDFFSDEGQIAPDASSLSFTAVAGGSPMNVAIGLSRLERQSAFFTGLAQDALGERLRAVLASEAVETDFMVEIPGSATTLAMVTLDDNGSPRYVFYNQCGADRMLETAHLPSNLETVHAIHVGSYALAVSPTTETLEALVARERDRCLISLDPNIRLKVEPDVARWRERINTFAAHAHLIKISDEDLASLYPDRDPEEVIRGWLNDRCPMVIMTRGGEGVTLFTTSGSESFTPEVISVVDAVGAGDSFMAALLAWLDEQGLATPEGPGQLTLDQRRDMVEFAMRAAAHTCQQRGPDLPRRHEIVT
ncbi:carbohydrate kinase family protein [Kushneria phyllosphaerae]|uniref:Fructokinase n=1 Tax=Kushneria phyllosphaerae TaxID=2100822 RepID=A0A2R8CM32_9GAMM|nr:carbohydrate kinase [Kushneria phyllosphaerae]SPJ33961.1 Fructokinase [Kushneria phyllosphaerae]